MQINMPETGTFFFISDHCHVIENVKIALHLISKDVVADMRYSGAMGFPKGGWLATIHHGSGVRRD